MPPPQFFCLKPAQAERRSSGNARKFLGRRKTTEDYESLGVTAETVYT